ncbi:hypothetical protein ACFT5D_02705 [Streptomyces sp. NPDC057144]|uniref:hypothetical protein n=1 Tax=Streptomyces sp. NPDC057144 TaxID=3346034 RepID=UPI003639C6ED
MPTGNMPVGHSRAQRREEAENLAHEVWIAVLRHFARHQETYAEAVAPLFVIARRKIADWYVVRSRRPDPPATTVSTNN